MAINFNTSTLNLSSLRNAMQPQPQKATLSSLLSGAGRSSVGSSLQARPASTASTPLSSSSALLDSLRSSQAGPPRAFATVPRIEFGPSAGAPAQQGTTLAGPPPRLNATAATPSDVFGRLQATVLQRQTSAEAGSSGLLQQIAARDARYGASEGASGSLDGGTGGGTGGLLSTQSRNTDPFAGPVIVAGPWQAVRNAAQRGREFVNNRVIQPINNRIVQPAIRALNNRVIQPINNRVVQPAVRAVQGAYDTYVAQPIRRALGNGGGSTSRSGGGAQYGPISESQARREAQAATVRYEVRQNQTAAARNTYSQAGATLNNPNATPTELSNAYQSLNDAAAKEKSLRAQGLGSLDATYLPQMEARLQTLRRRRDESQNFQQVLTAVNTNPTPQSRSALNNLTYAANNDRSSTLSYAQRQQLNIANLQAGGRPSADSLNDTLAWANKNPAYVTPAQVQVLESAKIDARAFESRNGMTESQAQRAGELMDAQDTLARLPIISPGRIFGREEPAAAAARVDALRTLAPQAQEVLNHPGNATPQTLRQAANTVSQAQGETARVNARLQSKPAGLGGQFVQDARQLLMTVAPVFRNPGTPLALNPNSGDRVARVSNQATLSLERTDRQLQAGQITPQQAASQYNTTLRSQSEALPQAVNRDVAGMNVAGNVGGLLQTSGEAAVVIGGVATGIGAPASIGLGVGFKEGNGVLSLQRVQERAALERAVTGNVSPQTQAALKRTTSVIGLGVAQEPLSTRSVLNAVGNTATNVADSTVTLGSLQVAGLAATKTAPYLARLPVWAQAPALRTSALTGNGFAQGAGQLGISAARLGSDGKLSVDDRQQLGRQATSSLATTLATSATAGVLPVRTGGSTVREFATGLSVESLGESIPQMVSNARAGRPLLTGRELLEIVAGNVPDGLIGSVATTRAGQGLRLSANVTNTGFALSQAGLQGQAPTADSRISLSRAGTSESGNPAAARQSTSGASSSAAAPGSGRLSPNGSPAGAGDGGAPPGNRPGQAAASFGEGPDGPGPFGIAPPPPSNLQARQPSLVEYALPGVDPLRLVGETPSVRELTRDRPEQALTGWEAARQKQSLFRFAAEHPLSRPPGVVPTAATYGGRASEGLFAGLEASSAAEMQAQVNRRIDELLAESPRRLQPLASGSRTRVYEDTQTGNLYRVGRMNSQEIRNNLGVDALNQPGLGTPIDWNKSMYVPFDGGHGAATGSGSFRTFGFGVLEMERAPGGPSSAITRSPADATVVRDQLASQLATYHLLTGNKHGDVHGGNIVVDRQAGSTPSSTLIDFEQAGRGPHTSDVDRIGVAVPATTEPVLGQSTDDAMKARIRGGRSVYNEAVRRLLPPDPQAARYQDQPALYAAHLERFVERQQSLIVDPDAPVQLPWQPSAGSVRLPTTQPPPDARASALAVANPGTGLQRHLINQLLPPGQRALPPARQGIPNLDELVASVVRPFNPNDYVQLPSLSGTTSEASALALPATAYAGPPPGSVPGGFGPPPRIADITDIMPRQLEPGQFITEPALPTARDVRYRYGGNVSLNFGPVGATIQVWGQTGERGAPLQMPVAQDLEVGSVDNAQGLVDKLADLMLQRVPRAAGFSVSSAIPNPTFGQGTTGLSGGNYIEIGNVDASVSSGAILYDPSRLPGRQFRLNTAPDAEGRPVMQHPFSITVGVRGGITPTSLPFVEGLPVHLSLSRNAEISVPLAGPIDPELLQKLNAGLNNPVGYQVRHDVGAEGLRHIQVINFKLPGAPLRGFGASNLPTGWTNLENHLVAPELRDRSRWTRLTQVEGGFKIPFSDNDIIPVDGKARARLQRVNRPPAAAPLPPTAGSVPERQVPVGETLPFAFIATPAASNLRGITEILPNDLALERTPGQRAQPDLMGTLTVGSRQVEMPGSVLNAINGHPMSQTDIPRLVTFIRALDSADTSRFAGAGHVYGVVSEIVEGQPLSAAGVASLRSAIQDAATQR